MPEKKVWFSTRYKPGGRTGYRTKTDSAGSLCNRVARKEPFGYSGGLLHRLTSTVLGEARRFISDRLWVCALGSAPEQRPARGTSLKLTVHERRIRLRSDPAGRITPPSGAAVRHRPGRPVATGKVSVSGNAACTGEVI